MPWLAARLVEWAWRYLPMELAATLTALAGAVAASHLSFDSAAIAVAGAWAENIGYYGLAFLRELRAQPAHMAESPANTWSARLVSVGKTLLWEFGVAEALDSFVVRPLCMYGGMRLIGNLGAGIVVGKLAADVIFYAIAIIFSKPARRAARPEVDRRPADCAQCARKLTVY